MIAAAIVVYARVAGRLDLVEELYREEPWSGRACARGTALWVLMWPTYLLGKGLELVARVVYDLGRRSRRRS